MTFPTRRGFLAALAAGAVLATPLGAMAQAYPDQAIRLVVPFPPGGGGDTLARLVMQRAAKELGQPIVVDNRPGAGGNMGAQVVAKSPADGYTLLYGTNGTHGINKWLYKRTGYDPQKDFEPVSKLTHIAAMLVVRKDFPARSVRELMELAKANPGKYTFGSAGNGTTSHLAMEILKQMSGLDIRHIPFRGGAQALTDLMGGRIDIMLDVMPNTAPHARTGRVRGLAVSSSKRLASHPDVPTIAESGLTGFDVVAWDAIYAPKGTPRAIVDRLNDAIHKALADPELRKTLIERGAEPMPGTPEELAAYVDKELRMWQKAVEKSGARID
ncbi:Bug family tripartite tricarboxylate transporter substrate binding protein [Telluria beijingensis]|uniref:Bug family tripartite tricarboxylate transporter substrate binding protein n=1 Tax=Telluria beijingensis TaxID=3068633 RepID=UPI002795C9E6|nr:tripartite tricarboxylate transporter substrate binding protein [Massilia sp. REN29]